MIREFKYDVSTKTAEVTCGECGDLWQVPMSVEQAARLTARCQCIQDIIPEVDSGLREMFISGMCPRCWDKMTGGRI